MMRFPIYGNKNNVLNRQPEIHGLPSKSHIVTNKGIAQRCRGLDGCRKAVGEEGIQIA